MNIYLLEKYRKLAQEEYKLKEIVYQYPRCRYRWMHDKKELLPKYQILEHGSVKYFEKLKTDTFTDRNEVEKLLKELRNFYVGHLYTKEKLRRCKIKKSEKIIK
jgi:dGTP triphosphohydrolase